MSLEYALEEAEPSTAPTGPVKTESAPKAAAQRRPRQNILPRPVLTGLALGAAGAATSLLANVVGSVVVGQHPFRLTRVYLTFLAGEGALGKDFMRADNIILSAGGCCLYLLGGMLLGVLFYLALYHWLPRPTFLRRCAAATVLSLALWVVNFYGVLSWLQPLLSDGDWIVRLIPWWVAAGTHLVFGWTVLLIPAVVPFREPRAAPEGAAPA
jgi:hypothetical protein